MYLNTHTYYSLRYGTFSPETLLELGRSMGLSCFALTDINTTSACLDFIRLAPKYGIRPIVGVDFREGIKQHYIALAKDNDGFSEINRHLTGILNKDFELESEAPAFEGAFVVYPFEKNKNRILRKNEFMGISPQDLPYIRLKQIDCSKAVILSPVTFRNKRDFNAHRLLRAIDLNTLLSKLPITEQGNPTDCIQPLDDLLKLYADFPEIIANITNILQTCKIHFDFSEDLVPQNQKTYTGDAKEDLILIQRLCSEGLSFRYPKVDQVILDRIKMELDIIEKMGFISYFLMNWDIVSYARSKGYFYVGRGSGANSIVAYLLRITNVDPIELDLYFERFINLFRTNPPDFDIDFSWTDRDDVTAYIFKRFKHVALVATYNTFQYRAVIRELGKVFGLPKTEIDQLSRGYVSSFETNHLVQLVLKYGNYIHGFPSHLSIHASGIIIAEKPINFFTATFMPPKGYPTIQFDMHVCEDVGLFKFDILSQRGLGKIKDAIGIIKQNHPDDPEFDIDDLERFKSDKLIKQLLITANAIGCFYVESPAMRMLLKKLQVDNYLGLVAASSVIRPGVAKSGMMQAYIQRYRHPEKRKEAHPVLLELMPETYGVMVYQEDVIKVAHFFAGLTLGEADKMRRGMSGKFRSREEFQQVKATFFANCVEKNHSYELTTEVWRQIESFAGYAFAKGHSASYAVESYQSLFLKAYYPLEYMVATINNFGGFYSTELYVYEARKYGAEIHSPCVNNSELLTTIQQQKVFIGYHLLYSFGIEIAQKIVRERQKNGCFLSFDDFIDRVSISLDQICLLIRIDAFRFTGKNKRTLMWEAHLKIAKKAGKEDFEPDLFRFKKVEYELPNLQSTWEEDAFDQMELLGFPLYSPFSITTEDDTDAVMANDLYLYKDAVVWIKGYLIHNKRTTTSNNKKMFFGTFLDSEGQWLDTVHFPEIADRYQFRGKGIYKVKGKVVIDYDCITIEVQEMEKLGVIEDPRYSNLRAGEGIFHKKIQEETTLVTAQVLGLPKGRSHY
jgi:DNA polymerase-3 subunit alpha